MQQLRTFSHDIEGGEITAPEYAEPAVIPEGEPGRSTGPVSGRKLAGAAVISGLRICRYIYRAAHIHDQRCRHRL